MIEMKHFLVTPAAGKRLIAWGMLEHPSIRRVLEKGTLVIIAGTTNGYIAEEILGQLGEDGFDRRGFHRGIIRPPYFRGESLDHEFQGDVVIRNGGWEPGITIFDVADELGRGDVVLKGANALEYSSRRAAVYIGNPMGGTVFPALQAAVGRKTELIVPVGLEKMIHGELDTIALKMNSAGTRGPGLLPVPGEVFTEVDALRLLAGVEAEPVGAGGVHGAEGSVHLLLEGSEGSLRHAEDILKRAGMERPYADF
ncbi:hypothetical protein DNK57_04445 [Methanothermobacter thermautotrophicus]|uniref:Uncharacterized protein n=2 Tax=Methanothermobacter thermautotrophicus TaxID=145262 RepID=A0A842YM78_METTF|nr:hypothetical protein [Methanothermobacter thermautotrophicus]